MKDNDDKVDQLENCNAFLAGILVDSPAAHESGGEVPDASTDKDSISSNDTDDDPKEKKHSNVMEPVAGWCIPLKYRSFADNEGGKYEKVVKVLVINANSGPDLLFPKGQISGWENDETVEEAAREALEEAGVRGDLLHFLGQYEFKSKTLQYKFSPEGLCKASMFALLVKEELQCWPEQNTRQRSWLTIPEAGECCRYKMMRDALEEGFTKWLDDQMIS
ncbi:hypothetical protein OIU76_021440 [Salix suchowensis]|nr:hypothetical protein OIU76_021440 [Salix suchowensis]KAJ6316806.1 hypothetical protein OIU78_019982 [Salix suchowensis]